MNVQKVCKNEQEVVLFLALEMACKDMQELNTSPPIHHINVLLK